MQLSSLHPSTLRLRRIEAAGFKKLEPERLDETDQYQSLLDLAIGRSAAKNPSAYRSWQTYLEKIGADKNFLSQIIANSKAGGKSALQLLFDNEDWCSLHVLARFIEVGSYGDGAIRRTGEGIYARKSETGQEVGYVETFDGIYAGELQDGKPHGKGQIEFRNGDHYNGEWVDGKMHGWGELHRKSIFRWSQVGLFIDNFFIGNPKSI